MSIKIRASRNDADPASVTIVGHPDECPVCHRIQKIDVELVAFLKGDDLQLVYRCNNKRCDAFFIAYFRYYSRSREFYFKSSRPGMPLAPDIPEVIGELSPEFARIYTDASKAEHYGLDGVTGVGYRKALEFLIKDYAIYVNEDSADEIKETWLADVVKNYIDDERLRKAFNFAKTLGTDHGHYTQKWEDYNLEDLKKLIGIAVRMIEDTHDLEEFEKGMKPNKSTGKNGS